MALTFDPQDIRSVVFDMGGVFFLPSMDRVQMVMPNDHPTARTDQAVFAEAHYQAIYAYDTVEPADYTNYLVRYVEHLEIELESDHTRRIEHLFEDPAHQHWNWSVQESQDALFSLSEIDDLTFAVVSNCDGTAEQNLLQKGVCQVGDGEGVEVAAIVDSGVVGVEKPDPAVFAPALEALEIAPNEAIYVGDSVRNDVDGAVAAGLHPVHIDPYDLYPGYEHDRVQSLSELVTFFTAARP